MLPREYKIPQSVCSSHFCNLAEDEKLISKILRILKGVSKEYGTKLK